MSKAILRPPVTRRLLDSVVERLVSAIEVEKIILFGSYAAGKPTRDSDLDLLVIAELKETGVSRYMRVSKLLEPRTIPIDIVVKTPSEIRNRLRGFDPFLRNVFKTGKVLYEKKA